MNRDNYITIQGWMRTELDLKGNDLMVYAIIYGFSQEENQEFTGSLQYLADWCGATKNGIQKNLKNLIERGLIRKTETSKNGVKFCAYSCIPYNRVVYPIQQSCTNNIEDNIENNNIITKSNNEEFLKPTESKQKKPNLYSKCLGHIDSKTDDPKIRQLLVDWLNMYLEKCKSRDKPVYANVVKGKLNMLDKFDKKDWQEIIEFNIQRGYEGFYPVSSYRTRTSFNESSGIHNTRYSEDDNVDFIEDMERNGKRIKF